MPLMPEGNHKDPFSFMACNNPYMMVKVLVTAPGGIHVLHRFSKITWIHLGQGVQLRSRPDSFGDSAPGAKINKPVCDCMCICVSLLGMMEWWDVCMLLLLDHFGWIHHQLSKNDAAGPLMKLQIHSDIRSSAMAHSKTSQDSTLDESESRGWKLTLAVCFKFFKTTQWLNDNTFHTFHFGNHRNKSKSSIPFVTWNQSCVCVLDAFPKNKWSCFGNTVSQIPEL